MPNSIGKGSPLRLKEIEEQEEVWKRFKEAGTLDEDSLKKKDKTALIQRLKQSESELHDYQHNMGLLLIERNDYTTHCKQLHTSLAEAQDRLKQEQAAHLIALTEGDKRKESLQTALAAEKGFVYDLEKALRVMHAEFQEIQLESKNKIARACEMVAGTEPKALATESALQESNTFLEEQNKKHIDAQRKLKDLEVIEDALHKERQAFDSELRFQISFLKKKSNVKQKKMQFLWIWNRDKDL